MPPQPGSSGNRYARLADGATAARRVLTKRVTVAPSAVLGLVTEAAWMATHAVLYPAGLRAMRGRAEDRYSLAGLPPLQRGLLVNDVTAAGTPILLVHGLIDNRSIFARLQRTLRHRGFGRVETVNLPLYASDVPTVAGMLGELVADACLRSGHSQVHVVAHSLGGLVARYYVQVLAGDERVHTLVTLGTPHEGTRLAHLVPRVVPYRLVASLRPGSPLLAELAAPAPGCRTRFIAVGGELDSVVRPESALLHHPDLDVSNVTMPGLGHHSLPFNGDVARRIATVLARLDPPVPWPDRPDPTGGGPVGDAGSELIGGPPDAPDAPGGGADADGPPTSRTFLTTHRTMADQSTGRTTPV